MMDIAVALREEAGHLGREVTYCNAFETIFAHQGSEHTVTLLVYDVAPLFVDDRTMEESRFAVYVDGALNTSGIVCIHWREP